MFAYRIENDWSPLALQIHGEPNYREQSQTRRKPGKTWEECSLRIDGMCPSLAKLFNPTKWGTATVQSLAEPNTENVPIS
jgi:hypothetical protein